VDQGNLSISVHTASSTYRACQNRLYEDIYHGLLETSEAIVAMLRLMRKECCLDAKN
jgi:hypothetical protein